MFTKWVAGFGESKGVELEAKLARVAVELRLLTEEFLELLDENGPAGQSARSAEPPEDDPDSDENEEKPDGARTAA